MSSGKDFSGGNGGHGHPGSSTSTSTSVHNNNNNNSNNPNDYSKKEEFRKYLEKTGVLDALTKTLVGLYEEPERPANAIEYIKRHIGGATQNVDVDGLRRENDQLKAELEKLRATTGTGGVGGGSLKRTNNVGSGSFAAALNSGTNPKTSGMAYAGGSNKGGNASANTTNNA